LRNVSPRLRRSTRALSRKKKTIVSAGGHVLPDRPISYPDIYVAVGKGEYGRTLYAKCQIKLKRKLYRYLVWKHEGVQHSFYLGRVKILAPLTARRRAAPASSAAVRSAAGRGAKKKGVYDLRAAIAEQDGEE
jgi:hypothetical protein